MQENENNNESTLDEKKFLRKINLSWKSAGDKLVRTGLEMFFAFRDDDTPRWAKLVILSALAYFVSPLDSIPDIAPLIGFTDDFGVVMSALAVVAIHIKSDHKLAAKELTDKLFKRNVI